MALLIAASIAWLAILRGKIRAQTLLIQQRLESETALEHRYRQLFERNLAGVFTMDQQGRILDCNDACVGIFGYSDKQDVLAAGSRAALSLHRAMAGKLRPGEVTTSAELKLLRADGQESWLLLNSTQIESDAGPLTEGTIIDITELKQTVRKLEERTTFLNTLVSSNPLGVAITDANRKIVTCNHSFEQMFLYPESEIIGLTLTSVLGIDATEFRGALDTLASGQPIFSVTRRKRKDGVDLDVEAHGVPIVVDGKVVGVCAIYQDISERMAAEAELRATKEAAEMASRAKSEFLANMSHEIRTPMNGILLAAELACADNLTVEQREYLETIRTSGNSLLLLLNDILDLSKIEAGKMELHSAEFSVQDCLTDCLSLMRSRALQKNLDLTLRLDPSLPDHVEGDSLRLRQVILNLLGNALKFTQQGSIAVDVTLLERRGTQLQCRFSVSDTGIGIAPEKCSSIFREFEQADSSTTRRFGGTGLGLAISSKLVGLMGGVIDVKSQVGQGSTFSFTACFSVSASLWASKHLAIETKAPRPLQHLRILLAEDNAINRKLAIRLLERAGHLVVPVENGRKAIQTYLEQPFDVILMDVHMPELDGIEATRQIRLLQANHGRVVPIIAVTASAMKEDREACLAAGMDSYISKPICTDELIAALEAVSPSRAA
jgi:PAS domain S-box-containing protein